MRVYHFHMEYRHNKTQVIPDILYAELVSYACICKEIYWRFDLTGYISENSFETFTFVGGHSKCTLTRFWSFSLFWWNFFTALKENLHIFDILLQAIFSRVSNIREGCNNHAGWIFFLKLINISDKIKWYNLEFFKTKL